MGLSASLGLSRRTGEDFYNTGRILAATLAFFPLSCPFTAEMLLQLTWEYHPLAGGLQRTNP